MNHVQEQEFNRLTLTLYWTIHYREIRKTESTSSWRWEQFVDNHSSNHAFQSWLGEASARRTHQENKLKLHKEILWRLACEEIYLPLYMAFLCRRTGLAYCLCFLTVQRGIQASKKELGCWDAQSMLDCWLPAIHRGTSAKELFGRLLGFSGPAEKTTLLGCFICGPLRYWQMPSHFIMLQSRWQKSVAASRTRPPQPNKKQGLERKSLAHKKLQTQKS